MCGSRDERILNVDAREVAVGRGVRDLDRRTTRLHQTRTLLPEASEVAARWFADILRDSLEERSRSSTEINSRFLGEVASRYSDAPMSEPGQTGWKRARGGRSDGELAIVGSHSTNASPRSTRSFCGRRRAPISRERSERFNKRPTASAAER